MKPKSRKNTEKKFTTTTNVATINATTPSVGILLVDNWMAKWQATYSMQVEDSKSNASSGDTNNDAYEDIGREKISAVLVTAENNPIGRKLTEHSKIIKQNAITNNRFLLFS